MRTIGCFAVAVLTALLIAPSVSAAVAGVTRVATGVSAPMFMTSAPGDRTRLFIAERSGAIRILNLVTGGARANAVPDDVGC